MKEIIEFLKRSFPKAPLGHNGIMKKLIGFLSRNKVLLFILLMGLTPLVWFKDGLLITGGDFPIPLDPIGTFQCSLYNWYPYISCGEPNPHLFAISPWFGFWALFKSLGLPLLAVNKLWFIFVFMLAGLSMYYLVSVVFEKEKHQVIALVASIFYMFNVYVMVVIPVMATPLLYGALPLILGLYIKGLRVGKCSMKYAVLIGVASLLIASAVGNLPIYAICGIMIFSYLIYHLATGGKKEMTRSLAFTLKATAIYLLINLWWLYPYISNNLMQAPSIKEAVRPAPSGSPFYETFRLFSSWAFYAEAGGAAYFPFAHYYKTPLFIALTFLIPILAFSAALFRSKNKYIPYFLGMAIVGIFAAHGAYRGYFGTIYNFFYSHIPGFWIFREPFAKFTAITALSFAVLMGFASGSLYKSLTSRESRNFRAKSLIVCVIAVILISAWPILTGDVIFSQRGKQKSHHVKVPDYWFEAGEWFNDQDGDFRVLVLPQNHPHFYCGMPYEWGYGTADITPYLVHQPLIEEKAGLGYLVGLSPASQELISATFRPFQSKPSSVPDMKAVLSLMNVRYILQRNDIDLGWIPDDDRPFYSPGHIESILETQEGIRRERTFGELDIYEIDDRHFLPHIYSSTIPTVVAGNIEALAPLTYTNYLNDKPALFFTEQQKGRALKRLLPKSRAFVFSNINPLDLALQILEPDYGVKVGNSKKPLVFEAEEDGVYQVWRKGNEPSSPQAFKLSKYPPPVHLSPITYYPSSHMQDKGINWRYVGSVELKKGKHRIEVEETPQELVIVPEKKIIETEGRIQNYLKKAEDSSTYLFSKELSSDVDSWEKRSLKRSFYIPSAGKYSLRVKVSPQYVKAPDYGLKERIGGNLRKWSFIPKNVRYFTSTRKNILTVNTYLDGDSREREFLGLKKDIKPINLEKYPNFEINYLLKNPEIQRIEIILGVDLNNDGKIDIRVSEELPLGSGKEFSSYSFNLYEKVKDSLDQTFPPDTSFHLVKIYLKVSKREDIDCSIPSTKGWYQASLKNFGLYGFSKNKYIKSRNYAFNERISLHKELKKGKSKAVLSRSFVSLDLEKYPYIDFIHQNENPKNLFVNAILYLDFDGDRKAEKRVIQEGITPENCLFNALELAKSKFPNKKHYYLSKLIIKIFGNSEVNIEDIPEETLSILIQHLQIYNEEILPYEKAHLTFPILKIDYRKLFLIKSGSWYTAFPVYLREGYHNLEALFPGLETELDFVAIEPENRSHQAIELSSKQEPEIVFQKINPTKYRVKVKNVTEPFWLVFSESFHPQWRAYVRQSPVEWPALVSAWKDKAKRVELKEHFIVNGYANGWYINSAKVQGPKSKAKEMEIVLEFMPQRLFEVGVLISGLTFLGCVGYLVGTRKKRGAKGRRAGGKVGR